ncbi:uncharacterized protein LOC107267645 [Cephus cinctus]|uniref:Uncharacterized protein LOC107267645 n=1 Tax=Cephus cinctus TaxID=211228 RepID=A0AAJ7FJL6_CEPCN|nr:uncharacterized protein LOC107267645 [Cephus cinctus]
MEKKNTGASSSKERKQSTGEKIPSLDEKLDKIVEIVSDMRHNIVEKRDIKKLITEIVKEEIDEIKQEVIYWKDMELETLVRKTVSEEVNKIKKDLLNFVPQNIQVVQSQPKSYRQAAKSENIIIVKPVQEQGSETTKKQVKERIDIKSMHIGVTKVKKGRDGAVILNAAQESEIQGLKNTNRQKKPKIRIIGIDAEEMEMNGSQMIETIKTQNDMNASHMKIIKKIRKIVRVGEQNDRRNTEGTVILEVDTETHNKIIEKRKLNLGWKKCPVQDFVSVKRCFKCWGYNHIAKYCKREEACQHCAGKHKGSECKEAKKRYVNCMFKIQKYHVSISDEHDALDKECPTFKRMMEEERKRTEHLVDE